MMIERIRLSACSEPGLPMAIAQRLGISRKHAAANLSHLRRAGKVSWRNGVYGPPDEAGATPA